jgi:Xaa-Pro aminopeptidase
MTTRIRKLQHAIKKAHLDSYLVTHLPHIRYLCGFSGSNGVLLISQTRAEFYTDGRYTQQVKKEVKGARCIIPERGQIMAAAARSTLLRGLHPRIGFQPQYMTVASHTALTGMLEGALLVPHDDLVEPLTTVKDTAEIRDIERATHIVDEAFAAILSTIRPGVRELDVVAELEYTMLQLGSEGTPFETICASGRRSALPHGTASAKRIGRGEFVTLDFGALVNGYCSDITRTVVTGKASRRHKRIYDIVKRAQAAGVRRVRPGGSTRAVDAAARNLINRSGFSKEFSHGTGHGIGLEVHQAPSLSHRTDSKLAIGMVVTVEPGIYIAGFGGVRIEDDVLVTRAGHRVLTRAPRKLIEL